MHLHLPRTSFAGTYILETFLQGLGVTELFSNHADPPEITKKHKLKVSKVSLLKKEWDSMDYKNLDQEKV